MVANTLSSLMNDPIGQFRLIAKAISDPICLLTETATIRAANPAFCRLLALNETDLFDRSLSELSNTPTEDIKNKFLKWRKSGSPIPGAIDFLTQKGEVLRCIAHGNLLQPPSDSSPALILIRIQTRQVTNQGFASLNNEIKQLEKQIIERKRAEKELIDSESKVRLLLESAGEMIFGINNEGDLTFVNSMFLDSIGQPESSALLGKNAFEIIQHRRSDGIVYSQQLDPIFHCLANKQPVHNEHEYFCRIDGTHFPVEYRCFPILQENQVVGAVVTASDITERRKSQEEILRLNKDLEKRVTERTSELEQAITKLAQSEKLTALGDLVAGVAHEINTPIGIGVTSATHLQEQVTHYRFLYKDKRLTQADFEKYLKVTQDSCEIIVANLNRSANLVRSFKQVAVDQVSESRRLFNVKQYIQEIVQSLRPKLKNTRHTISINCSESINLNSFPGAFSQIVSNLVLNSIIHGFDNNEAGLIKMDISKADNYLSFIYSDNGNGMNEEGLKKIFDPFYSTRRGRGGTGLGMHIVYNLVTKTFNGSIDCESSPNSGIRFSMRLHAPPEEADSTTEAKQQSL